MGALAFEAARFGRKMARCDQEVQKHRRRHNAVADARAIRLGADPEAIQDQGPAGEEEMQVYTNSPITHNHISRRNPWPAAFVGAAALGSALWLASKYLPKHDAPANQPTTTEGQLNIEVIPGSSEGEAVSEE